MNFGFLIYDSRSGSTLLASYLNAHPDIFVSLEAAYILEGMKFRRELNRFPEDEELRNLLQQDKRLSEWSFDFFGLFERIRQREERVTLKRYTETLLQTVAHAESSSEESSSDFAKVAFLKQGLLSGYLPELREIWPEAFLVHIFRDGRAVFSSKKRSVNIDTGKPMSADPVQSALRWKLVQENVEAIAANGRVWDVRYDDLILNQDAALDAIWEFLQVKRLPPAELSVSDYAAKIPESQKQIHPLVGKKVDPSRLTAWKADLSVTEIWRYEKSARRWLEKRGYPLSTANVGVIVQLLIHKFKARLSFPSKD